MLIYHPAYDAYHCVFRLLAIISKIPNLEVDKVKLLDFYCLFPSKIKDIRLPQELSKGRAISKSATNLYRDPINPLTTFREIQQIQNAALNCVAASGFIDIDLYTNGIISRTTLEIPISLMQRIENYLTSQLEATNFILDELSKIPLKGINGLKDRTSLMEYRYDIG